MVINRIIISSVTSKSLRDKKYIDVFPEYYELSKVSENNLWHNKQNVLEHVIKVFEGLEKILLFESLSKVKSTMLNKYLSEEIGGFTREDILKIATLLHDIAIADMIIKFPDGTIISPSHEIISASRITKYSERFGLNNISQAYTERIVRNHGIISDLLTYIENNENRDKYLSILRETVGDVDIELVLLMLSDDLGSDLKKNDPSLFKKRKSILYWMLGKLINLHN